jgi:hypothetical protein
MSTNEVAYAPPRRENGCITALVWIVLLGTIFSMIALFLLTNGPDLLVTYGIVSPERMSAMLHMATPLPVNAQGTPLPTALVPQLPPLAPPQPGGGSLPPCSSVTDTRTACQADAQGAAAPAPAAAPAVEPTAMVLAPAAIECYKGSFYTCEELAEMGDEQAVDAVQETDAFIDPATVPTAPPAFVEYATNACAAAAVKSPLCP